MIDPYYYLVPQYRTTGSRELLLWKTYNLGAHVIVANNKKGIVDSFRVILKKYGVAVDIIEYRKIDIVMPSKKLIQNYAAYQYNYELSNFRRWIFDTIDIYYKEYNEMPKYFKQCICKDNDYNCSICECSRYVLDGISIEQLFEKTKQYYRWKDNIPQPFDGIKPDKNKPLYTAILNGGHHNIGVKIDKENDEFNIQEKQLLFCFHGDILDMPQEIINMRDIVIENKKTIDDLRKKKWDEDRAQDKIKEQQKIREIIQTITDI